ncbi:MAG: carbonic anhydrase [Chthoniobacterales bacterium]
MCDQHSENHPESHSENDLALSRRHFLKMGIVGTVGAAFAGVLGAQAASYTVPKPQNVLTPDEALIRLKKGNTRYVNGSMTNHDFAPERADLAGAQNPFAGILSCADSRVAPEFAFDTGRGDLFVVRVAGNFVDDAGLASFEFGVAVLGVPLIVVLGHQSCGAISSTINAVQEGTVFPGHIPTLVKAIKPAVVQAEKMQGDLLKNATRVNVALNVERLKSATPILKKATESGKLKVVGGVYNLETGKIDWLS